MIGALHIFGQAVTIKFATVAPEGSTWMNLMNEYNQAVQKESGGQIKFKIYSGGVQGDEKDVLRKIRIGQLHSGGFTGVGLGEVLPEVRILDNPFLFKSQLEIDGVCDKFFDRFASRFEEKGYILLGFTEVGWVYIFTNKSLQKISDLKGVKMWLWEGDPLAGATFRSLDINPIPLSITDVLTSLQTGLIDGVYTSPLACVALQWFTKTKYMLNRPLTNAMGAVLLSSKVFDKLSPEQQTMLIKISRDYFRRLTELSRQDNEIAIQEMQKRGLIKTDIKDAAVLRQMEEIGVKTRRDLVGKLYDQSLLDEMEKALKEFRADK
jgi:TRAP-type C4-dicarboxylate transport system substrate-binding protein